MDIDHPFLIQSGWVDITPRSSIPLAGSQYPNSNFDSILAPIEANVVIIQVNNHGVILISLDVLFIGHDFKDEIISKLGGLIKPSEIFIWATHNHYAPPLDPDKPKLGCWNEEYFHYVSDLVTKLIIGLTQDSPKEGSLSYGCFQNDELTINRRKRGLYFEKKSKIYWPHWGTALLPNERNYRDGKISTISIRDNHGKQLALIWSFACHPVSSPGKNDVRADYPGEIRRLLRAQMHAEIPVVFLQGFSGDLKPPSFETAPKNSGFKNNIYYHIMKIINGKNFGHFDEQDWSRYIASLWAATRAASENSEQLALVPVLEFKSKEVPLKKLGLTKEKNLKLCSIKIGAVRIIAFSAEPVAEWGPIVGRVFPGEILITTGCFEDVASYLPVEDMIGEGGYEVVDFMERFNISGQFIHGMEQEIITSLNELK